MKHIFLKRNFLMNYKFDELSASNIKILLSLTSSIFLILTIFSTKNISDTNLMFTIFNYYASNALAFYCINTNNPEIQRRKSRIINLYILCSFIIIILLKIYNITENIQLIHNLIALLFKTITTTSCLINIFFAIKDDDNSKRKELIKTQKKVKKKILENEERKKYTNRDKNVKMNAETRRFIEKTENKKEGRQI